MEFKESPNTWPRYLSGAALWQLQNLQAQRVTWLTVSWGIQETVELGRLPHKGYALQLTGI